MADEAVATQGMSLGVALYPTQPAQDLRRLTHLADRLGFANAWFGDSQNIWRDAYVTMGASAVDTQHIIIGSGVTNAVTRHVSVLASAWVTLAELTGGRVAAGFGTGFTSVRTLGLGPSRLADLEKAIDDVRALWAGGSVTHAESGADFLLSYVTEPVHIPIYIAASGPRLLHMAGRIGDGVILLVGTHPDTVGAALDVVAAGAADSGRRLEDLHTVLWCPAAIADHGTAARDLVRPHVAGTVMQALRFDLPAEDIATVASIRETYDYYQHMVPGSPHSRLVTDSLLDRFAVAGTPQECRERLDAVAATGIRQVSIIPFVAAGHDRSAVLEGFAAISADRLK